MKAPMTDLEFRNYLDSDGHMVKPEEFRLSIYQGGVEHSLRRVVWRHLLNIFPEEMSGRERFDYMKKKENEYLVLRDKWRDLFNSGQASEEAKHVASLVRKDVMRTDRTHKYYSGTDDNKNLKSLFHLLVTYALTHPEISYCQGMSDLASPLLVVQKEEAQAYLCFCGLMKRLRTNFLYDDKAITTKLQHLNDLVNFYDPVFGNYLKTHGAEDLFFCYRWLLLEMKREFPFDDSMYMLEVMWSTIPMDPPDRDLPLTDPEYSPSLMSMSPHSPTFSVKQTLYAHLLAKRRHPARDVTCTKSPGTEQNITTVTPSPLANEQNPSPDSESPEPDENKPCSEAEDTVLNTTGSNSDKKEQNQNGDMVNAIDNEHPNETDEIERDMNLNITNMSNKLKHTSLENDNMIQEEKLREGIENGNKTKTSRNYSRRRQEVERYPRLISGSLDSSLSSAEDAIEGETELTSSSEPERLTQSSEPVEISEIASDLKRSTENQSKQSKPAENEDENHVQFDLSLGENDIQTINEIERTKKEKIPEIKGSFFSGMKKILSSPKKRPGRPLPVTEASVVTNKPIENKGNTKLDMRNSSENFRLGKGASDKGTSDKILTDKGKERNFKKLIIGNNKSSHKSQENQLNDNHSEAENGSNHSEEDTLFKVRAKNIKQKDKSDSDSGNGSLTRSQNFTESTNVMSVIQGDTVISDQTDLKSTGLSENKTEDIKTVKNEEKNNGSEGAMSNSCPEFRENHFDMLNELERDDGIIADCAEANDDMEIRLNSLKQLPPPEEFGFGNPFLMFLCLTVLIQHRDFFMKNGMEYDELAMHFDKMVRKHNVNKVLHQTRMLYSDYIRMQQKLRTEKFEAEQLNV